MKYWLLTTEYPPFHGGGISTYCYYTSTMLAAGGHEVTVFIADDTVTNYTTTEQKGVTLVRFNSHIAGMAALLGYTARLSYAFAHVVKTYIQLHGRPGIIEAQDYFGIAYYLQQWKLTGYPALTGIPIVLTLHSPAFLYLRYNRVSTYKYPDFWTCEMEKDAIVAADGLISPSAFLITALQNEVDLLQKNIPVVPNPYGAADPVYNGSYQRNKVVFYGKLSPQKGIFELLQAFSTLWEEGHTVLLELIGATDIVYHPELKTMGQLVKKRYQQYINKGLLTLTGKIKPEAITTHLQSAHIVIVPSIVDNLPYAVMEAMSRGKVVLASVQGGQQEIIEDGRDGFLFDHTRPGHLQQQLLTILALGDDDLKAIGTRAIEKIKTHYSFSTIYPQKMAALNRLLHQSPALPPSFPFRYQQPFEPIADPANKILSVVIPYYNMGSYIQACLQSVLQSTYPHLEVLIIDDGSTTAERLVAEQAAAIDSRIKVYSKKNEGLALTRNYGAQQATGYYLSFLDADDKIAPGYYEQAIRVLAQYPNVFFAGAWVQYFENSHATWPTFTPQPPYVLVHNPVNSSGLVYKWEAFIRGGLNDKTVDYGLEDYESVIHMLHSGYNGVVLPEVLFYYRVRYGSMFRNITRNKLLYAYQYIAGKHAAYYSKFAPQVANLLNANGPGFLYDNPTFEVSVRSRVAKTGGLVYTAKAVIKRNKILKKMILSLVNRFR